MDQAHSCQPSARERCMAAGRGEGALALRVARLALEAGSMRIQYRDFLTAHLLIIRKSVEMISQSAYAHAHMRALRLIFCSVLWPAICEHHDSLAPKGENARSRNR